MGEERDQIKRYEPGQFEENTDDLYERAPCGYISTLPDGTVVRINQTLLRWLGYQREEIVQCMRFQDLFTIGSRIFYETHLAPLIQMQGFVNEINVELRRKDRAIIPTLINTIQYKNAEGRAYLNRSTVFDITDRKKYEQELLLARKKAEEASKAKADFLSMMSHEIRAPMNAIIGISNLLEETPLTEQQREYVQILQFSSEHLLNLINDILDFSKIEAGKVVLEERSFEIRPLISAIAFSFRGKVEEKNLAIHVAIDEKIPAFLRADPLKISQVLGNLLSNAVKFTEEGLIVLRLELMEISTGSALIRFQVSDTGIGIAEEQLGKVFEEFTQANYDIGLKYGGTGLGLAICQKLLALYGSKMSVESQLGSGTTFSFALRLKIGEEPLATRPAMTANSARRELRGVKILVAEDNAGNVYVLSRFLQKWGVEFDIVKNGREAVESVKMKPYDLVLMDLQMPEMNGYDAARAIRSIEGERFQSLPIIALSASTKFGYEEQLESSRFNDFVGKPFRPEELFQKIAANCSREISSSEDSAAPSPALPASEGRFGFEKYYAMIDHDPEAFLELAPMTIDTCENAKREMKLALEQGDRKLFEFQAHKLTTTIELLHAESLREALHAARAHLETKLPAPLDEAYARIGSEIELIILALQGEMERIRKK